MIEKLVKAAETCGCAARSRCVLLRAKPFKALVFARDTEFEFAAGLAVGRIKEETKDGRWSNPSNDSRAVRFPAATRRQFQ